MDQVNAAAREQTAMDTRRTTIGAFYGLGAVLAWSFGLVAARHGMAIGLEPVDLAFHRYVWMGLIVLPSVLRAGPRDLGGVGWGRGIVLTLLAGPPLAIMSYAGFHLVPLAHGGIIQPSASALVGLLLAAWLLKEHLPTSRVVGALVIVAGLVALGGEAVLSIGSHGLLGDFTFLIAGTMFSTFAIVSRMWGITPSRGTAIVLALSIVFIPIYAATVGFDRMLAAGWFENVLQIVVQGVGAGPGAIFLFSRAVVALGGSRASMFVALVPATTVLIGYVVLGEAPSIIQIAGLAIVALGFRLTQRT